MSPHDSAQFPSSILTTSTVSLIVGTKFRSLAINLLRAWRSSSGLVLDAPNMTVASSRSAKIFRSSSMSSLSSRRPGSTWSFSTRNRPNSSHFSNDLITSLLTNQTNSSSIAVSSIKTFPWGAINLNPELFLSQSTWLLRELGLS